MNNLDEQKLNQIIELFKSKTEKKCYRIEIVEGEPSILEDKLGGLPYLPIGEDYPTDENGKPLSLLMQVNLKNINLPNFAKEGIFEVFTNNDYPCQYSIKLYKEGLEYQKEFPKLDYKFPFISKPIKIKLTSDVSHMTFNDYRIDKILCPIIKKVYRVKVDSVEDFMEILGYDEGWEWREAIERKLKIHKMTLGGYPDFTQTDPRVYSKAKKDECLFKIDSGIDLHEDIVIGDNGIIFGFISEKDLKKQNFNNALVDWDCQ